MKAIAHLLTFVLAAGCSTEPVPGAPRAEPVAASEPADRGEASDHADHAGHGEASDHADHAGQAEASDHADHAEASDHAEHAGVSGDLRTIMVDLGERMAAAQTALWVDDHAALADAATAIADHPHVGPDEVRRIQGALGPDFAGFAKADKAVHDGAIRLSEAAGSADSEAILRELAAVQADCVACHAAFRERLAQQQP